MSKVKIKNVHKDIELYVVMIHRFDVYLNLTAFLLIIFKFYSNRLFVKVVESNRVLFQKKHTRQFFYLTNIAKDRVFTLDYK